MAVIKACWVSTALLFAAAVGCGGDDPPPAGNPVSIGLVIDQTGSIARPQWQIAGALAVTDANRGLEMAGGFHGLSFEVRPYDTTNVRAVAGMRAQEAKGDGVRAIVADTSGDDITINTTNYDTDPANDIAMPIVCMACTSPNINNPAFTNPMAAMDPVMMAEQEAQRNGLRWNFRTSADSDPEAVALLNMAHNLENDGDVNGDGTWKISILTIDDGYGNGFFSGFERARDRLYPTLVLERVTHPREPAADYDWDARVALMIDNLTEPRSGMGTATMDAPPDAIMEVTFPLFAAGATRAYINSPTASLIPFLHHHNFRHDQTLIKLMEFGAVIDGHEGVSHALTDFCDTSGRIFDAEMNALSTPVGFWDAQTYDAVMVIQLATLVAMQSNGLTDPDAVTPAMIRDGLGRISDKSAGAVHITAGPEGFAAAVAAVQAGTPIDYDGPSGPLDFDENGNMRNNFVRFRVAGTTFTDIETYNCVTDLMACPTEAGACMH